MPEPKVASLDGYRGSPPLHSPVAPRETLLSLLRLCSSLFPIGAFAYSQGLEGAVEAGWVRDERSLKNWLLGVGETALVHVDLPLLRFCHAAWQSGDVQLAHQLSQRVLANRETREMLQQERHLGSAFAAVLVELGVVHASELRESSKASYVSAFALGAAHYQLPVSDTLHGYTYAWIEQQINAAIRLLPVGHIAGQRCMSRLLQAAPQWIEDSLAHGVSDVGASTFGLALASCWHEQQYSRLFRA